MKSQKAPFARYRETTKLTPEEIGKLFNVNKATIFRWELGKPHIPVKQLDKAERITGIPREELRPDIFGPVLKREQAA